MPRRNFKKYFVLFSSAALLLLFGERIVKACSDGPAPDDYYPSFFDNRLPSSGHYEDFRYSAYTGLLYEEWYGEQDTSLAPDTADGNRAEWAAYTGAPLADVDSFVYGYDRAVLTALYAQIEKGTSSPILQPYESNKMLQWFRRSKDLEALGYLLFAKQVQPYANQVVSYSWEPAPPLDKAMLERLRKNGTQLYAAAKAPFIRDRYAYQVLRLAFVGGQYEEVLRLYKEMPPKTSRNMQARVLGLEAGALFKMGRDAEAAYRYSHLFDLGDEWRRSAFISYHWTGADTNDAPVLDLCKNAHERAVVQVLTGLYAYEPALENIAAALKEDPTVNGLDALVTREINKVEERYITDMLLAQRENIYAATVTAWPVISYSPATNEYGDSAAMQKKQRLEKYRMTTLRLANLINEGSKKNPKRPFWTIAGAYLSLVTGNKTDLKAQMEKAEDMALNGREKDQLSVIKLLNVSREEGRITPETEEAMLPHIQWLESRQKTSPRLDKTYRDFTNAYLAAMYLRQGDTVKAIYALAHSQRAWGDTALRYQVSEDFMDEPGIALQSLSAAQFEKVKAFASGKGSSDYDDWLRGGEGIYSLGTLLELEGTYRLREHRFAEAAAVLEKADAKALAVHTMPNPFRIDINDHIEWDAQDSTSQITKLQFARQMAVLKGKSDAESMLQYGIGLYAMSHYGIAHRAYDYYRSGTDDNAYYADTGRLSMSFARQQYYNPTEAERIFVQIAQKTTNAETKAKALFMAAKCWQKRCPLPPDGRPYSWMGPGQNDPYYRNSLQNPYFRRLKVEVGNTNFYAEAESRCSYLEDYAKRR